jgi:hypothetical protein
MKFCLCFVVVEARTYIRVVDELVGFVSVDRLRTHL